MSPVIYFSRFKSELLICLDGISTKPEVQLTFLACTNLPKSLDSAFKRRFDKILKVGLPKQEDRERQLRLGLKNVRVAKSFNYEEVAKCTEGLSGSDIMRGCENAKRKMFRRLTQKTKGTKMENGLSTEDVKTTFMDFSRN